MSFEPCSCSVSDLNKFICINGPGKSTAADKINNLLGMPGNWVKDPGPKISPAAPMARWSMVYGRWPLLRCPATSRAIYSLRISHGLMKLHTASCRGWFYGQGALHRAMGARRLHTSWMSSARWTRKARGLQILSPRGSCLGWHPTSRWQERGLKIFYRGLYIKVEMTFRSFEWNTLN